MTVETERHTRWLAMLSASDKVLVQLALLAVAAVFVWERLRGVPEPWRGRVRLVYVSLALGFLLVQLVTTRGTLVLMLAALTLSIVARGVWLYWKRAHSGASVKG